MKHTTKLSNRILSLVLTVLMLAGLIAVAIPVMADESQTPVAPVVVKVGGVEQALPYKMEKNTEIELNGVKLRFDSYYDHGSKDTYIVINPDGTIKARLTEGDLLWMPDVTVDATTKITTKVALTDTNCGGSGSAVIPYSELHGFGPVWNITANGQWGLEANNTTDKATIAGFRGVNDQASKDSYLTLAEISAADARGTWSYADTRKGWVDVLASKDGKFGNRIGYNSTNSKWDEVLSTVVTFADNKITAVASDEDGKVVATAEDADHTANIGGPIGFMNFYGKWDSVYEYTFTTFTVENALIGTEHKNVTLANKANNYVLVNGLSQALPYKMEKNTEAVFNGIKLRFDSYFDHSGKDTYVMINADGTIKARLVEGDLLWMPDVKVDATSTIHTEAKLTDTNCGGSGTAVIPYSEQHGFGPVWNITAEGQWGLEANVDNDKATIAAFRSLNDGGEQDGYLTIGQISAAQARGTWSYKAENAGLVDVKTAKYGKFGSRIGYNSTDNAWDEVLNTTVTFADGKITALAADEDGLIVGTAVYEGEQVAALTGGAVGFMNCYGKWDSVYEYTFNSFVVKNAVVGETHKDICLVGGTDYVEPTEGEKTILMDNATFDIESGIAFFDFKFKLTDKVPATAKLVLKKNGTEVFSVTLSTLIPDEEGFYTYSYHLNCETETDVLTLCLENEGSVLSNSQSTYEYGAAYAKSLTTVDPIPSSELNCKAYDINFAEIEDMELVPGVNYVGGHTWTYVRNSENGTAKIENGKLLMTGSKGDMLIFDDLNLNKTNFKFTSEITYLNANPEETFTEYNAFFGHLIHVSEADADGKRTGFIQSVTPNAAYLMGATIDPNAEEGKIFTPNKIGTGDTAYDDYMTAKLPSRWEAFWAGNNIDISYFNGGLGYGTPMNMRTFVGIQGNGYGRIGTTAGVGVGGVGGQCYANAIGQSAGFTLEKRVGKVGYVCSEEEVQVSVSSLTIEVNSKSNMTVDGKQYPIFGSNEIAMKSLASNGYQLVYAQIGEDILTGNDKIVPTRLTNISTKQVYITLKRTTAVAKTGLKWKVGIEKAGYDALLADPNVQSVKVGVMVVPTTYITNGFTRDAFLAAGAAGTDIDITASMSDDGTDCWFEGVRDIAENERNTSFAGLGYVQVTMKDGTTVVECLGNFDVTKQAYALSNLVSFDEKKPDDKKPDDKQPDENPVEEPKEKAGCKSTVAGFAMISAITLAGASCVCFKKKKHEEE